MEQIIEDCARLGENVLVSYGDLMWGHGYGIGIEMERDWCHGAEQVFIDPTKVVETKDRVVTGYSQTAPRVANIMAQ